MVHHKKWPNKLKLTAAILFLVITVNVSNTEANPGGLVAKSEEQESENCYNNCVTTADMSLWPTTPPADEDDEEPRCKADIRYTAECIYQCEDLSLFSCIAGALQISSVKLKKMLEAVSVAKYCQGCRFFDNENCYLTPRTRLQFNITKTAASLAGKRHPFIAALSPFINGLYLLDNVACHSASKPLRDTLVEANVLDEFCEWLHCESVAIQIAPGCNDVVKYMQSIVNVYSQYLKCQPNPSSLSPSSVTLPNNISNNNNNNNNNNAKRRRRSAGV